MTGGLAIVMDVFGIGCGVLLMVLGMTGRAGDSAPGGRDTRLGMLWFGVGSLMMTVGQWLPSSAIHWSLLIAGLGLWYGAVFYLFRAHRTMRAARTDAATEPR